MAIEGAEIDGAACPTAWAEHVEPWRAGEQRGPDRRFLTLGGKGEDYAEGLKYAIAQGWLEPLTKSRFRLTETGFVEIRSSGNALAIEIADGTG